MLRHRINQTKTDELVWLVGQITRLVRIKSLSETVSDEVQINI